MNRFVAIIAGIAICLGAMAKDNPEDYHVKAYKTDGSVIEGYNDTRFSNHLLPKQTHVAISSEYGGKPVKYSGEEVRRIIFTASINDSVPVIFEAVKAQTKLPNLFSKNPKPYKERVFLRVVYYGDNVKGYAMPYTDHTFVPGRTTILYTWRYFYLTKDGEIAKAYWDDTDGVVPGMKKVMKFYLREFPQIVKMVDDGTLTPEMFQKNPAIVLPLMDRFYTEKKK